MRLARNQASLFFVRIDIMEINVIEINIKRRMGK